MSNLLEIEGKVAGAFRLGKKTASEDDETASALKTGSTFGAQSSLTWSDQLISGYSLILMVAEMLGLKGFKR